LIIMPLRLGQQCLESRLYASLLFARYSFVWFFEIHQNALLNAWDLSARILCSVDRYLSRYLRWSDRTKLSLNQQ
jgi:hypothetical protein